MEDGFWHICILIVVDGLLLMEHSKHRAIGYPHEKSSKDVRNRNRYIHVYDGKACRKCDVLNQPDHQAEVEPPRDTLTGNRLI